MKLGVLYVPVTQASRSAETGPSVGLSGFILSPGSGRDTVSKEKAESGRNGYLLSSLGLHVHVYAC